MKAMVIRAFGGPEVFSARQLPRPQPEGRELLVRVHATSINPVDTKIRQDGSWAGIIPPEVIGYDVAGEVAAVGPGVIDFKTGDRVFYTPEIGPGKGSYAEYNLVDETIVAPMPDNLSFVEAAALPLAGATAWEALVTRAGLSVGETVLIHGAGGVGLPAVQIALAAGGQVIVSASPATLDTVRGMGVELAIDYRSEDFVQAVLDYTRGEGVDLVLDTAGGELLARSIPVTKFYGRMVGIVNQRGSLDPAFIKNITFYLLFLQRGRLKLLALKRLVERGLLKPVIDSILPLEEVGEAHRRIEAGGLRGKIILQVAD